MTVLFSLRHTMLKLLRDLLHGVLAINTDQPLKRNFLTTEFKLFRG